MMLGMPASSSTAIPTGRRSQTGASSVRKTAIPKLIGMPMIIAISDVISVP